MRILWTTPRWKAAARKAKARNIRKTPSVNAYGVATSLKEGGLRGASGSVFGRWVRGIAVLLAVAVSAAAVVGAVTRLPASAPTATASRGAAPHILVDAGHGGVDGGAFAADGTLEKDLNLDIALALRDMLRLCGYTVSTTRESDISIHNPDCTTIREQKVSDLRNRLALYEQADLVISVHQNKFEQANCRGTQVFYSKNHPAGKTAATAIRQTLYTLLQPDNTRELKAGGESVFLLHKTTVPAVLAECGFLSNPDELKKLQTPAYRQELAFALCCGVLAYAP